MNSDSMKNYRLIITLIVFVLMVSGTVFGQISGGEGDPYMNAQPLVVNTGTVSQKKIGPAGVLGIRLYDNGSESDAQWLQDFLVAGKTIPAFVADTSIVVYRHSIEGINSDWILDSEVFSFDTNAPIAVNGVFSVKSIVSPKDIETALLGMSGQSSMGNSEFLLCAQESSGIMEECAGQVLPIVSISVSPSAIAENSNEQVMIDWEATNADECHAINGPGFFADKQLKGTDISNRLSYPSGSKISFTIGCTNQLGIVIFKSAEVSVQ